MGGCCWGELREGGEILTRPSHDTEKRGKEKKRREKEEGGQILALNKVSV